MEMRPEDIFKQGFALSKTIENVSSKSLLGAETSIDLGMDLPFLNLSSYVH